MAGASVDLTGTSVGGWDVVAKAPAQNRVRFWTARHDCGNAQDVAQTAIQAAIKGKGTLPPCVGCTEPIVLPPVSHGMHLACGRAHPIGTECVASEDCRIVDGRHVMPAAERTLDLDALRGEPDFEVSLIGMTVEQMSADLDALPDEPEPAEPASERVFGKAATLAPAGAVLDVIRSSMAAHPRSHQRHVGPSELGGCERKLGHRMAFGKADERDLDGRWRPQVGTAVHEWLNDIFGGGERHNGPDPTRWHPNYRVDRPVAGSLDLYDARDQRVIDFKVTGETTRKRAARGDVDERYEVQLDLYALGMLNDDYPVRTVALLFLPASGSLADAVWYERPFDVQRALAAVARRDKIEALLQVAEPGKVLSILATEPDHCGYCPALGQHCPGATSTPAPALTLDRSA